MKVLYPSVEKPQYAFYRKKPVRELNAQQSIYDIVFETNKDNMDWLAVRYLSGKWTFKELKILTDKLADAFVSAGLRQNETVLMGLFNCVEAILCMLAINKVGAVTKWIDIRANEKDIEEYIESNRCRFFVCFDELIPKVSKLYSGIEKIISVSPVEMLDSFPRLAYNIKTVIKTKKLKLGFESEDKRVVGFREFLATGDANNDIIQLPFDKNRPSIIIQSSGTTGKPKSIVHSDFSATSCARSLAYSDMQVEPHKRVLVLLPPWIAYSLGQAIIYPLACGANVVLDPNFFDHEALFRNIGKFDVCFGVPLHYRYLLNNFNQLEESKKEQVYALDLLVSGGDKISPDENESFDKTFKTPVVNGYGNNECWGCLTVNCSQHNKYGSVGIPKYGETIISYSNDTQSELPFGEVGEICAYSDTQFLCYDKDEKQTAETKILHKDGKVWLHTGDLGIIDEEGFIFLKGRIRRVITRAGFKISAYTIEDTITALPMVKECVAVQVKDKVDENVPMVFIVLNKSDIGNEEAVKRIILGKCAKDLKTYEIPKHIQFVESLPYTINKKYDFSRLETVGNEYVDSLENN